MTELRQTPVTARHRALGAKMVPFAGYEMPLEYAGILAEHRAVRAKMGLFDVSHMGEIEVRGPRAMEFCQRVSTNDASRLKPGKVQYSCILNDRGGMLDDCTLYRLGEDHFLFVVNAARRDAVSKWLRAQPMPGAEARDRSDEYGLLALQGRGAEALISRLVRRDLSALRFCEFTWVELVGAAAILSRTGYTGEDGFEIYLPWGKTGEAWDLLGREGAGEGLVPVGLGARDTLRLEMGYLLYGNEMDEEVTPLEAGIGWAVKLEKGHFNGRDRLLEQKSAGIRRKIFGVKLTERGIPRPRYEVRAQGKKIGEVTSGTFSPVLQCGIALAMLEAGAAEGAEVEVVIRGKGARGTVVRPPFVPGSLKR